MRKIDIIKVYNEIFSHNRIPAKICTYSGTQFQPLQLSEFRSWLGLCSISTSSPHFHHAIGTAEAAVKTEKSLLKKNKNDFGKAVLAYRNTPLETDFRPAILVYGRKLCDTLSFTRCAMTSGPNLNDFPEIEGRYRARYKNNYDHRDRTHELEPFMIGSFEWITDLRRHRQVVTILNEPRSYLVRTEKQAIHRNRYHLIPAPYLAELLNTSVLPTEPESHRTECCPSSQS